MPKTFFVLPPEQLELPWDSAFGNVTVRSQARLSDRDDAARVVTRWKADRMFTTKNDLDPQVRETMALLLGARLADAIDLQTQCKQAHWNVKGPGFYELHLLFDKVSESVGEYVDEIAERIVQLGGFADGTARSVARRSTLAEYPEDAIDGQAHAEALSSALATFAEAVRNASDAADGSADADTMDLFTEISRGTDKWLWMVEAHLPHSLEPAASRPRPLRAHAAMKGA